MKVNVLLVHGGGPTAVINSSLYGAIRESLETDDIENIYGALGGTGGIIDENFINFREVSKEDIELLLTTPGSSIGTSRYPLYEEDYVKIHKILKKNNIKYVFMNGGNGTMDTCGKLYKQVKGDGIKVVGIPKTIDNDIVVTDHCPGYGSAANFIANSVSELTQDVSAMPIHVSIIETMGRNTGWIAASSALARKKSGEGPHLIYLPERAFNEEEFLEDVEKLYNELGGVVVVASEGLLNKEGEPIVDPIFKSDRATYFGDVSSYLAELVIKKLGIKARSEKPGILGRSSISLQSKVDREEAIKVGREAVRAAIAGKTGVMVGLKRISTAPYKCETILIPVEDVMMHEKAMPDKFINERGNNVTQEFIDWCGPLIGESVPEYINFNK